MRMSCHRSAGRAGRALWRCWSWGHLDRERGGVDDAVHLELEEQAVAAGGHEVGAEGHDAVRLFAVVRVDVQVGEIALPQGDQVAASSEVRLDRGYRAAVADDGEVEVAVLARPKLVVLQRDGEALDACGRRGSGQRARQVRA